MALETQTVPAIAARMFRVAAIASLALLAACKPAASDDYHGRGAAPSEERTRPLEPVASPDIEGAAWALGQSGRLLYGKPGQAPLMALACDDGTLEITRFVRADAEAKAVLALIGNGHVERLWVDARKDGEHWLWRGAFAADDQRLEALTGGKRVEATIPGAGSLILNPSQKPAEFIAACARLLSPEPDLPATEG